MDASADPDVARNTWGMEAPLIGGHESSGIVTAVGPDVRDLKVGDHVTTHLIGYCGYCTSCIRGVPARCVNPGALYRSPDEPPRLTLDGKPVFQMTNLGGFAEQMLVHENSAVRIPKEIPFDVASLIGCGVITGAGAAINAAQVGFSDKVAVIGCGGVGLNAVQGALIAGATTVIAIDLDDTKLELAKAFGATHTINSSKVDDVPGLVREITGDIGVDHAFEVVGLKATAEQGFSILDLGGVVYTIGILPPGTIIEITGSPDLLSSQRGVQGVYMGKTNPQYAITVYAELYLQGRLKLDELVSAHVRLDQIEESYVKLEGGGVARSIIMFD